MKRAFYNTITLTFEMTFLAPTQEFIDPMVIQRLEERIAQEEISSAFQGGNDKIHRCRQCNFTYLVPNDIQHIVCPECQDESCVLCHVDWKLHMEYGYVYIFGQRPR